ncbi:MAG: AraC family transcriptional regulator [Bacteroidales bacterium]|nr:AraC family transcriptional regulator [Bacteroidales bacterium]
MKPTNINNYEQMLWFTLFETECRCEYRVPRHALMFVQEGRLEVRKGDTLVTALPGDIIFLRRDCGATMAKVCDGTSPYRSITITMERPYLKDFFNRYQTDIKALDKTHAKPMPSFTQIMQTTPELRALFESLVPYGRDELEVTPEIQAAKLDETVKALIAADECMAPTLFDFRETWKIDLLEFMENNFTYDLTMEEFASYSARSLSTFKRDFAKISELSPERWLQEKRLVRARDLVRSGQSRPSDVYVQVGFRNRSHFATAFKRRFGCTPSSLLPKAS